MKKSPSILAFLIIGYVLPLNGRIELIIHPFNLLLMLSCVVMLVTQPDSNSEEIKENRATDRNSYWVIYGLAVIGIMAPTLEWAYFSDTQLHFNAISIVGLLLIMTGLFFRIWSIQVLGRFFTATVQIQADHQLVQEGPYQILRHPSYTGAYLAYIGSGLLLNAYWGLIIAAIAMGIAYIYRISAEEKALLQKFGVHYHNYQQQTYRMIPFIW